MEEGTHLYYPRAAIRTISNNIIRFEDLEGWFHTVADHTSQFLALINACYGGDLFDLSQGGGSPYNTAGHAADAITAGGPYQLADSEYFGQTGKAEGSIFFDGVFDGIAGGHAEQLQDQSNEAGYSSFVTRPIIRLPDLEKYLVDKVEALNERRGTDYARPWQGHVSSPKSDQIFSGGFFFISRHPLQASEAQSSPPSGPASSLPGRPDVKIFNRSEEYPIQGLDVTEFAGEVDWRRVAASLMLSGNPVAFVYARATMGVNKIDAQFHNNWENINRSGLWRGAYHVYDFCAPAEGQMENVRNTVPVDPDALPFVIDLGQFKLKLDEGKHEKPRGVESNCADKDEKTLLESRRRIRCVPSDARELDTASDR